MQLTTLSKKSVVVVFAYAPMGLGHLRVSDALYHGLPDSVTPSLLGAQDKSISTLYRFISIHWITRWLMEFFQKGWAEYFFAFWYRKYLQSHARLLYQQLITILDERIELPEVILLVATHFGLAHQVVSIRDQLEKHKNVRVFIVVQVTDDSPQVLWYIPGADAIFVPSEKTKEELQSYGKEAGFHKVPFFVNPYPINPRLRERLSEHRYHERRLQCDPHIHHPIHIAFPVSGAAVDTRYYQHLIRSLSDISKRFIFHVISKNAPYTKNFLSELMTLHTVRLTVSEHDRGVVNKYEELYQKETISIEITKPSEQAFKALLDTTETGGAILLFSEPVGRQEYDNLDFLRRHHFIPGIAQERLLLRYSREKKALLDTEQGRELLELAHGWRGIELPSNATDAARFISYCLDNNIFHAMFRYNVGNKPDEHAIQGDGVEMFWKQVEQLLDDKLKDKSVS